MKQSQVSRREFLLSAGAVLLPLAATTSSAEKTKKTKTVTPQVKCSDPNCRDQDDLCIWVHPTDPAQSTIIAADKHANRLFVYDLSGKTLQAVVTPYPGNIDARYGFPLGQKKVDIVAFNRRGGNQIIVYQVDPATRRLERIDDDSIRTGACYGGTLFRSPRTGKFYFFVTSTSIGVEQYELFGAGGKVKGKKVRAWKLGLCEAAVGDDESGKVYIGEERKGVWELGGEPDDPTPGKLAVKVGEHGVTGDVEGLALYYLPRGKGYLLVSNQGSNNFKIYERDGAHQYVGTFAIQGAQDTDGIDVTNASLGGPFARGLFACHTGKGNCPILLTPWEAVARAVEPGLQVDTSWSGRK